MAELQEKLRKDMVAFQQRLDQVQQHTILNKAESLAKEAEVFATSWVNNPKYDGVSLISR